jgi:hypothetical protein
VVHGWQLKNVERAVNFLVNSYRRGNDSFHYLRVQRIRRPFCPPPRPHSEGV